MLAHNLDPRIHTSARERPTRRCPVLVALSILMAGASASGSDALPPATLRFVAETGDEVPDFRRHVAPLLSRLGCNSRACHGSFQGRGGFRLSLFGYDLAADHAALVGGDLPRVDREEPLESLILQKPTGRMEHGGKKRLDEGTWAHRLLLRWVLAGAPSAGEVPALERLEVQPEEVVFGRPGDSTTLRVVARWSDGTSEDVTPLARFQTNDEAIAEVDPQGRVTARAPGDTHVVAFYDNGVAPVAMLLPVGNRAGGRYPDVPTPTAIDRHVVAKLRKLGIVPSRLCTDEEFLRRVSLDVTGQLPLPDAVKAFLADPDPEKRRRKVEEILGSPAYATWWATKLCDITGNNERHLDLLFRAESSRQWFAWIRKRLEENTPYDELVAGIVLATSRRPGQDYLDFAAETSGYVRAEDPVDFASRRDMPHYWARSAFRTAQAKSLHFSYAFLGVRLQCAECHKHPFDRWTQDDFGRFTALFERVNSGESPGSRADREDLRKSLKVPAKLVNTHIFAMEDRARSGDPILWPEVFVEPARGGAEGPRPKLLGGAEVEPGVADPRVPLMAWMRSPENPYFARAIVNRVWAGYFHRGLVEPVDDQNLANPPVNAPLLDELCREFVGQSYDLKWLHRAIAGSQAYQRSWAPNDSNRTDARNFSHAIPRRLPAEPLYDAILQATSTAEAARAGQADPRWRAIAVQGSTAQRGVGNYALQMFGKPARTGTCDCERSDEPNLLQAIYLQNDHEVLAAIDRRGGWLHEVATRLGVPFRPREAPEPALGERMVSMARQLPGLQAEADTLQAQGKRSEYEAKALRIRINRSYLGLLDDEELAGLIEPPEPTFRDPGGLPPGVDDLIGEAYLRTLARRPTEAQLARARRHVEASPDVVAGLRDVLWALINAREFCINY